MRVTPKALELFKGASSATYTVALTSQPTAAVTVTVTVPADAPVGADPPLLTFGTQQWAAVQTVTVSASEHAQIGDTATIAHHVSGGDYADVPASSVTVTIVEQPAPETGVRVTPKALELFKGASSATYTVALTSQPTAAVTVTVTVPADAPVGADPPLLTFGTQQWAAVQTVTVSASEHAQIGDTATVAHHVSGGDYADVPASSVTVTIVEQPAPETGVNQPALEPLELSTLQVSGGGAMYPAFARDVLHYAMECADSTTLRVRAQALRRDARLTLLRDDPAASHVSTGTLDAEVTVNDDHDLAIIEVSDNDRTTTYVVHCLPTDFPSIVVLTKTTEVSAGFLFLTTRYHSEDSQKYIAVIDNNGVPRFHREYEYGFDFRPAHHTATVAGQQVRYVHGRQLFSADLQPIETLTTAADWDQNRYINKHDFLITEEGTFIGIFKEPATRDFRAFKDKHGNAYATNEAVQDTVIREFSRDGTELFYWNSWIHRNTIDLATCTQGNFPEKYAHVNSIQLVDRDIIASVRSCSQVLRIDRSGGTGAVVWKLGTSAPGSGSTAEHLELVDDTAGEFCAQHTPTVTDRGTVLLFDNGVLCNGPRKSESAFTRVVEYDISSGTRAVLVNEFRRPTRYGVSHAMGSVQKLDNGRWLVAWGLGAGGSVPPDQTIAVSELNPATGRASLQLHMSNDGTPVFTYRAYRSSEFAIPLNLP